MPKDEVLWKEGTLELSKTLKEGVNVLRWDLSSVNTEAEFQSFSELVSELTQGSLKIH